jgi:hypothetical protein
MPIASQVAHIGAVISALQAEGLNVGDATGKGLALPFCVTYDISNSIDGTLGKPYDDSEFVVQVTCVGRKPQEARWVEDKVISRLTLGLTVSGRSIPHVFCEPGTGGIRRDDDPSPAGVHEGPLWYCTPRFRFRSFS